MKLLYFGDRHNSMETPENRVDNFEETMWKKDQEILGIARREGVKYLLQPGDFWDEALPPLDFSTEIINRWFNVDVFGLLQKIMTSTEVNFSEIRNSVQGFIPMVGVVGNHELFGNNINSLDRTLVGFMSKMGLMNIVSKEKPLIVEIEPGFTLAITGSNYHIDIDTPAHLDDYVVTEKLGDIHIHIAHGMLTGKPMHPNARFTTLDQVSHTKADLTLTGDDHIGYPLTEIDGKYFVNTGAIPRLSADKKEMDRIPKVLLIEITKEHGLKLKEIPLLSAMKGDIILDAKKNSGKKEKKREIEDLREMAKKATENKSLDIFEIVSNLANEKGISEELKKELINDMSRKKESLDTSKGFNQEPVYIKSITLENILSHRYNVFNLSPGFNVFSGESRQGKSAVFRTLRWIIKNDVKRKNMIKKNADYAQGTIELSNGFIISRYSDAVTKTGGKNGYYITDPSTGIREFYNTQILPWVQELIGYVPFRVDEDKINELDLNFMNQGDKWFFVGSSDTFKAKAIGAIYGTQYADAVIRELIKKESTLSDGMKKSISRLSKLEEETNKYNHLVEMKSSIDSLEAIVEKLEELTKRRDTLVKLRDSRKVLQFKYDESKELIKLTAHLAETDLIYTNLKELFKKKNSFVKLNADRIKINKNIAYANKVLYLTRHTKELESMFTLLSEKHKKVERMRKLALRNVQLKNQVKDAQIQLEKYKNVDDAKQIAIKLKALIEKRSKMQVSSKKYTEARRIVTYAKKVLILTGEVDNCDDILHTLKKKISNLQKMKELVDKRAKITINLESAQNTLKATKHIDEAMDCLAQIKEKQTRVAKMKLVKDTKIRTTKLLNDSQIQIKSHMDSIKKHIDEYQEILSENGVCPLCFGDIHEHDVERIVNELKKKEGI